MGDQKIDVVLGGKGSAVEEYHHAITGAEKNNSYLA